METKPVFLIIEDNLIDQLVTKQLLKKILDTDQIVITNNGKEAIQWLSTQKNIQSVIILLDVQMPVMNGFQFLGEFHNLDKAIKKEIQIYMLSSTLDSEEIEHINNNDYVTGFLNKPFPIEEFKNKLQLIV